MQSAAETKTEENTNSFALSGPLNVSEQGAAIPLIYGECIVGAQAISGALDLEDIGSYRALGVPGPYGSSVGGG